MHKLIIPLFLFLISTINLLSQENNQFTFYFKTADFHLNKKECTQFNFLLQNNLHFIIKGYTDTIGTFENNKILSQKRTYAVYNYLKTKYPNCIIDSASYGETKSTAKTNALNRKVTIWLNSNIVKSTIDSVQFNVNKKGEKIITFNNIFFYANQAVLRPESIPALATILQQVNAIPDKKIEIRGHINWPLNREEKEIPKPYKQLSEDRAKTIYQYLINNGIDKNRLLYSGKENKEMLYPLPKNRWEMQQNMRVEIVIVK